jgi:serine/threonine-protein kinase HipA
MIHNTHVSSRLAAKLCRGCDEHVLKYRPGAAMEVFVRLTMPAREKFGPLLDGTN